MRSDDVMYQKEKVMGFFYVLLLFLSITIACCLLLFLYNSDFGQFKQKELVIKRMERIKKFQEEQELAMLTVDILQEKIMALDPGVNAIYEEDNIKYMIREIKNMYDKNTTDTRYKVFAHISDFYYMWYTDRKTLWSKKENVTQFQKQLEECEMGVQNKRENLMRR